MRAPADLVIIKPEYSSFAEGSSIIQVHDRDKNYIGNFFGVVIAVGPEYKYDLKPGDRVRFRRHEGVEVEHDGKKYLSLKAKWIDGLEVLEK